MITVAVVTEKKTENVVAHHWSTCDVKCTSTIIIYTLYIKFRTNFLKKIKSRCVSYKTMKRISGEHYDILCCYDFAVRRY